jgi:uncharacterized protein YfaS (alpha-2-macroglobulin family)
MKKKNFKKILKIAAVSAVLPLMVRPSPPRFLNFGDKCQMSVVLQNQTDSMQQVLIGAKAANLKFQGNFTGGWVTQIPPLARACVLFPIETHKAGTARIQCKKKKKKKINKKKKN